MRFPRFLAFALVLGLASPASAVAFDANDVQTVFFIRKTHTVSRVEYGVRLDAQCRPDGDEPVVGYWRRLNIGPDVTADFNFGARRAYGISRQAVRRNEAGGGEVTVRLRALSSHPIVVHTKRGAHGCEARASTRIQGEDAELVDIFVALSGKTSVDHIELTGRASDGRRVVESLRP